MPAYTEAGISRFAELIGTAVVAGYRDEQRRQMLDDTSRRSLLIDALLEAESATTAAWPRSPVACGCEVWSFCVIAATVVSDTFSRCLRSNRSCAASMCIRHGSSCPIGVGIVCVKSQQQFDQVVAFVSDALPGWSQRAIPRSARRAASSALRQDDVAGLSYSYLARRGVRRHHLGHRRTRRTRGDGQVGRHHFGPLRRPSRRRARGPVRDVSGVAGNRRLVSRLRPTTLLSPQHRALPLCNESRNEPDYLSRPKGYRRTVFSIRSAYDGLSD